MQLLEDAMDWPKIQKLVLAKTVPQKAGMEEELGETPEDIEMGREDNFASSSEKKVTLFTLPDFHHLLPPRRRLV